MQSLNEYRDLCAKQSLDEFLAGDPPAMFVHCRALDPLQGIDGTPGDTLWRLALDRDVKVTLGDAAPLAGVYSVLEVTAPDKPGADEVLLGCGESADVVIDDTSVSRAHAWVELRPGGQHRLRDNASAAGTRVNDEIVEPGESARLRSGAKVSLGAVDLLFLGPAEFYQFVRRVFAGEG